MRLIDRLRFNWNFNRILFLAVGTGIAVSSIGSGMPVGIFLGLFYAAMGFLGIGCAAGNCSVPDAEKSNEQNNQ